MSDEQTMDEQTLKEKLDSSRAQERNSVLGSKESEGRDEEKAAALPASNVSKECLRQSWLNLISSWGLTIFYLIFHFIVRYIAGSRLVCRFGEEGVFGLIPKSTVGVSGAVSGEAANKSSEIAEIIVFLIILFLLCVSLIVNFIIVMVPVFIVVGLIAGIVSIFK